MRVLFVSDTYFPSANGVVYSIYRLTQELSRHGVDVSILCPGGGIRTNKYKQGKVSVYAVPSLRFPIYPDLRLALPLVAILVIENVVEEIRPDIIHIQDHFLLGNGALEIAEEHNIKVVGTNHFMPENFIHLIKMQPTAKKLLIALAWRQFVGIYRRLDLIITPTKAAADLLRAKNIKKEVVAISNGIDLDRFKVRGDGEYLRDRYKIGNKKIALFVGRIDPEKRIDVVINGVASALKKTDLHLVLAGKGAYPYQRGLKRLIRKLGIEKHVTLTGFVQDSDLPNLYATSDVFVIASEAELQSVATMEAMASGLPVLAADAVALPLLVKDGVNGFLFEKDNYEDLAKKLTQVLGDDKLRKMLSSGSLEMIKPHDVKKSAKDLIRIYERLLEEKR